jgi:glucose dehydrogenase
MTRRLAVLLSLVSLASSALQSQVSSDRLVRAADEPQNWLMYSGTYSGQRYSLLRQVDATNV